MPSGGSNYFILRLHFMLLIIARLGTEMSSGRFAWKISKCKYFVASGIPLRRRGYQELSLNLERIFYLTLSDGKAGI